MSQRPGGQRRPPSRPLAAPDALAWLPPVLLAVHALAFGWAALGGGLLILDDHPGQLYRVAHAIHLGPAPWRLDPGWWAGYAELQFYPPGAAYLGAAFHLLSGGTLGPAGAYQVLLWVVWLLPGAATWALLRRVLPSPWLALPGAFLALTLSAGARSGVEEGLRWGLVAARLGWGLLPLLALSLDRWAAGAGRPPLLAPLLLAGLVLAHPSHAPAGAALVALAAAARPGAPVRRAAEAAGVLLVAAGLAGFWLVPLLVHLEMALPLAWGPAGLPALAGPLAARPLLWLLLGAAAVAWWARHGAGSRPGRWLLGFLPATAALVAADALLAEPLGIRWLPADRLVDAALLALVLEASIGLAALARLAPRVPVPALGAAAVALASSLSGGRPEPTLTLWPRALEWPTYAAVTRDLGLDALWPALREAPPGRILFLRSAVALDPRPEWWRPHSHLPALAPLETGRPIVGGTFTHPSPVAALLYTGSPAGRPARLLAEQRDGVSLFGRPLEALGAEEFNRLAEPLGISTVVATERDVGRTRFLDDNPLFTPARRMGSFMVFHATRGQPLPVAVGAAAWRQETPAHPGGWLGTGFAWSPLWRASARGVPLAVRASPLGLLEVERPPGPDAVLLEHTPGVAEGSGLALSALSALGLLGAGLRPRRRP